MNRASRRFAFAVSGVSSLAVVALAASLLAGCGSSGHVKGDASAAESTAAPVRLAATDVAVAHRADLTAGIPISGTLQPTIDVRINAPATETIDRVYVREGEAVRRGQMLAQFRTASLAPGAESAKAELSMRRADRDRMKNLLAEGAVSERDLEAAQAAYSAAEAQAALATKRLTEASVRAPVDGVIASRSVESGDRVSDGDPLFRLVNTRSLEFEASVPSEYVASVRRGAPVLLTLRGASGGPVQGTVARVNAEADPATRQVQIYVTVDNPNGALVGGLFASGVLVTEQTKSALAVPAAAVRGDAGKAWVFVVKQGRLARADVTAGLRDETQDRVEIVTGLADGDTVVTGPIEGLEPGQVALLAGKER